MPINGIDLLRRLPDVRGKLLPSEPLAAQTWFRVGGPAEILFKPADEQDLADFLKKCPEDVPITVLGVASNTLIRDGGVPGVVIRLGPEFAKIKTLETTLEAGAAAVDLNVARAAAAAGLTGLEFLCGIPGTIGGGLRMNAGAYEREFKDIVVSAHVVTRSGEIRAMSNAAIGFSYRHTSMTEGHIFTSATLKGEKGDPKAIQERMAAIQKTRTDSQPVHERTGGSTFANPDNDPKKRKAWQLIEAAGCRGIMIGKAQVSQKHCNFLINTGNATAADIENLGEIVRRRVLDKFGVDLRWEIQRIGITLGSVPSAKK